VNRGNRVGAGRRNHRFEPLLVRHFEQELREGYVVLDNQQHPIVRSDAVPIIEHGPRSPYFSGAVFAILLIAFLWLDRLRTDQLGVAIACVALTTIAGAIIAPQLNGDRPWFNYEAFAEKLEPKKAEAFSWDHTYGPLNWSRDGREMLRVKAKQSAYWKATNLDEFDGARWVEGRPSRDDFSEEHLNKRWIQTVKVVDRGLRSHEFVGAGVTLSILPGSIAERRGCRYSGFGGKG